MKLCGEKDKKAEYSCKHLTDAWKSQGCHRKIISCRKNLIGGYSFPVGRENGR